MSAHTNGHVLATDRITDELRGILDPVRRHVAELDRQIEEAEEALSDLREARKIAQRVIYAADPQSKPGPKKTTLATGPSKRQAQEVEENLAELRTWIEGHANEYPDGFTVNDLIDAGLPFKRERLFRYTKRLADQGVIRLDHLGGHRSAERFFKLAANRDAIHA